MGELSSLTISIVVISGVFIGLLAWYGAIQSAGSLPDISTSGGHTFSNSTFVNMTTRMQKQTADMMNKFNSTASEKSNLFWPLALLVGGWDALKIAIGSVDMFVTLENESVIALGLPAWVGTIFLAILGLVIAFAILRAIFIVKP